MNEISTTFIHESILIKFLADFISQINVRFLVWFGCNILTGMYQCTTEKYLGRRGWISYSSIDFNILVEHGYTFASSIYPLGWIINLSLGMDQAIYPC